MKSISQWIEQIETEYDVAKITSRGIPMWPFYKVFLFDQLYVPGGTLVQHTWKDKLNLAQQSFFGLSNYFSSDFTQIAFSSTEQRKEVDGQFPDKLVDGFTQLLPAKEKLLHLELPVTPHRPKDEIPHPFTASKLPLRLLEWWHGKNNASLDLKGEQIVNQIKELTHTSISFEYVAQRFWAQYKAMKGLLNKNQQVNRLWVVSSYMNYGSIYAAKERGIEVVEIQHGTITKEHFGYYHTHLWKTPYYPDYITTFGENEVDFFNNKSLFVRRDHAIPVGHFYIESIYRSVHYQLAETNQIRIVVSLQDDEIGEQIVPFMIEVAKQAPHFEIWFSPRRKPLSYYKENFRLPKNIRFHEAWNVYESIARADLHTTVYSTCAIEAPSLGTPNVLVNIQNRAKAYFSDFLSENQYTWYAADVSEYIVLAEKYGALKAQKQEVIRTSNNQNIKANYFDNVTAFLRQSENR